MSSKTRSLLKVVSLLIVGLLILMELDIVIIRAVSLYTFWLMVIAYFLLFISSK